MARVAPEVDFGSSTGGSHDDRARVQVSRKVLSCLLLIAVTAGRITGNMVYVLNPASPVQVFDCFLRPLLGGLSFMPFLRYDDKSKLYRASRAGCIVTLFASSWLDLCIFQHRRRVDRFFFPV